MSHLAGAALGFAPFGNKTGPGQGITKIPATDAIIDDVPHGQAAVNVWIGLAGMSSYVVLARKWRPQNFEQLAGQSHVSRALRNALTSGRIPHAFLFTGVRGVGKTTIARLFAKCLNCQTGIGPNPCGQCDACLSVTAGNHPDVLELDAASRTKVEQMREVLDTVCYVPTMSPYKVYILDEVHMLSVPSFNALLKTLEEPPPHVKFIFATTEVRKIPATILSRCQRYDLKRLTREELTAHLEKILRLENITMEEEALKMVVRAADGSVRDALSLLDQVISHGDGAVRYEAVEQLLGLVDRQGVIDLLEHILLGHTRELVASLDLFYQGGIEPTALVNELLELVHQITRYKVIGEATKDLSPPEDRFASRLQALSRRLVMEHLQMAYQTLLRGRQDLRVADFPHHAMEMLLFRVSYLRPTAALEGLLTRLAGDLPGSSSPTTPPVSPVGAVPSQDPAGSGAASAAPPATWVELVALLGQRHGKLALKLREQVVCLDYQITGITGVVLRMTHEVFGSPERLRGELSQSLADMGLAAVPLLVEEALPGPRPETISEGRERENRQFLQDLEEEVKGHLAVVTLQEQLQAELLRIEPIHHTIH